MQEIEAESLKAVKFWTENKEKLKLEIWSNDYFLQLAKMVRFE